MTTTITATTTIIVIKLYCSELDVAEELCTIRVINLWILICYDIIMSAKFVCGCSRHDGPNGYVLRPP